MQHLDDLAKLVFRTTLVICKLGFGADLVAIVRVHQFEPLNTVPNV